MKGLWAGCIASGAIILQAASAMAQSSLDALEEELKEVKQQHEDATAQNLSNFFTQVDQAMASPDAAVALYQQAGGAMPAPTPVTTEHETESATERANRLAQDQANATALGNVLQVHCGLLHYAATFVTSPNQKGLQDDFNAWLQKAAQAYPSLGVVASPGDADGGHHHHNGGTGPPFNLNDLKGRPVHDSIISKFLGFKSWGDKEQGGWAVHDIPRLFKERILDPSRATPTPATLAAWDIYIAMANADEPDSDKWTTTLYPPLQFERAFDDYSSAPGTEKLEALVQIIHTNPTHPQADDWIKRTKQLLDDYGAKHGGAPLPSTAGNAPPPSATNPNVIVSTTTQGDATIVTTHTNATPNPAPPH